MTRTFHHPQRLLICLCLAVITVAVYWPVHRFEFVNYDDNLYITENLHLRGGLTFRGMGWALTTPLDQWMPVTWLGRLSEYQLFGENAGAHHLVNVLLHMGNVLLLFGILNRMTNAPWRSALVAALFALHPLHVESVAWVTGLKDVLSMCFWLLTIWAYVRYAEQFTVHGSRSTVDGLQPGSFRTTPLIAHRPSLTASYGLTLVFFALALMSKPMAVTLPFVLLLLDYWPLGRTRWASSATRKSVAVAPSRLFREKLPFLALAAISCVTTLWAQRSAGPLASLERLPLGIRAGNALLSYMKYLGKTFWPTNLAAFYPLDTNLSPAAVIVAGGGLLAVTSLVIWRARQAPWFVTGWFWYLGTLVPVIGLVQVGVAPAMADRYFYVPSVGLFMMLCWSVSDRLLERRASRVITSVVAVAALTICVMLTRIQIAYWKDSETLFRHALDVTRENWLAHNNLGIALGQAGKIEEAIGHCEEALRINPDLAEANCNLGIALEQTGRAQDAMRHYEQAVLIKPDFAEAHYRLGNALLRTRQLAEAIGHFKQAIEIRPEYAEAHDDLGVALQQTGHLQEAMEHYEQAVQIKPDFAKAHYDCGVALVQLGRVQEAVGHWTEALRIKPDYPEAHYNLGVALERAGRVPEAIGHYEQAIQIKPDFAEAQNRLTALRADPSRLPSAP